VVQELEPARAAYKAQKDRLAKYGRSPEELKILPGVMPIIGRTAAEAKTTLERLQGFLAETDARHFVSLRLGHDVSGYPMDEPLPELPQTDGLQAFSAALLARARREKLTLRDLYNLTAAARGHWVISGTAAQIADTLEEWFRAEAADGFNILPPWFPGAFDQFVDEVVPELQRRSLFRTAYSGRTLRDHLGLARPESRFARARQTA
jgi:alkanesulfonate monooxygenase SsuD/methylene tetrahydromethanopterin reductase-like flavin-dependent oxidoreductase (luciferase family)